MTLVLLAVSILLLQETVHTDADIIGKHLLRKENPIKFTSNEHKTKCSINGVWWQKRLNIQYTYIVGKYKIYLYEL
jgi:hypothetical protein